MATVRAIVKGAMKKLSVLAIGREPTAAQAADGLTILQSLYREWVGLGVFGRLTDVLVTSESYDARENERVVVDNSGVLVTVNLPETITQELCGSGGGPYDYGRGCGPYETLPRPVRDGSLIVVADINSSCEEYYIYEANVARWVLLDDLTLDSEAPLSKRYEDGLKAALASRFASYFAMEVPPSIAAQTNTFEHAISMKADRSYRPVQACYF